MSRLGSMEHRPNFGLACPSTTVVFVLDWTVGGSQSTKLRTKVWRIVVFTDPSEDLDETERHDNPQHSTRSSSAQRCRMCSNPQTSVVFVFWEGGNDFPLEVS